MIIDRKSRTRFRLVPESLTLMDDRTLALAKLIRSKSQHDYYGMADV